MVRRRVVVLNLVSMMRRRGRWDAGSSVLLWRQMLIPDRGKATPGRLRRHRCGCAHRRGLGIERLLLLLLLMLRHVLRHVLRLGLHHGDKHLLLLMGHWLGRVACVLMHEGRRCVALRMGLVDGIHLRLVLLREGVGAWNHDRLLSVDDTRASGVAVQTGHAVAVEHDAVYREGGDVESASERY
jgi:hypothetical protein